MLNEKFATTCIALAGALALAGCAHNGGATPEDGGGGSAANGGVAEAAEVAADVASDGAPAVVSEANRFDRPGFFTYPDEDGRLWVFRAGAAELDQFIRSGDLGKRVVVPRAGPEGRTVKAPDRETVVEYLAQKDGFETRLKEGRLWIFRAGSENVATFDGGGEPAKRVTFVRQGPLGTTLMAFDREVLDDWKCRKPGFHTQMENGRLWVFRDGSEELAQFQRSGDLGKRIVLPKAGPGGVTINAPDRETAQAYMAAHPDFFTRIEDGRIWVFLPDSEALAEFESRGEPAKHVIRPRAGPMGMTVKAPDKDTANAYLAQVSR